MAQAESAHHIASVVQGWEHACQHFGTLRATPTTQTSCSTSSLVMHETIVQVRPKRRAPITQVLLVGGATRMPAFRRFVRNMTGLEAKGAAVDPDEVRHV